MSQFVERFDFIVGDRAAYLELIEWPSFDAAREAVLCPPADRLEAWRSTVKKLSVYYQAQTPQADAVTVGGEAPASPIAVVGTVKIFLGPTVDSRYGVEVLPGLLLGDGASALSASLRDLAALRADPSFARSLDRGAALSRAGTDDCVHFLAISRDGNQAHNGVAGPRSGPIDGAPS